MYWRERGGFETGAFFQQLFAVPSAPAFSAALIFHCSGSSPAVLVGPLNSNDNTGQTADLPDFFGPLIPGKRLPVSWLKDTIS